MTGNGGGDHGRRLVADARHADRTHQGGNALVRYAARLQAVLELLAFRVRTDQAELARILALHDGLRQALIQRMTMRHDEKTAGRRRHGDKFLGRVGGGNAHIIR